MKRAAWFVLVLVLLGAVGYGMSGQSVVSGTVTGKNGEPLAGCGVDRGLRLGVGFGGFDGPAYATDASGQFALPVNRGLNRLTFSCLGGLDGTATTVVWRGREPRVAVVLDEPS